MPNPPNKPGRARTQDDARRYDRHTPTSGVPVRVVQEEPTPPPQQMPVMPRTLTPARVDTLEDQVRELTSAIGNVWEARDVPRRMDAFERELKDNTKSTTRMEVMLNEMLLPMMKDTQGRVNEAMHHVAASSHMVSSVNKLAEKLDTVGQNVGARLSAIEAEQKVAAERFEAHDQRDREFHAKITSNESRISKVEERLAIRDNTDKIKTTTKAAPRSWWYSAKGVSTVLGALSLAIAGVIAAIYA